MDDIHARIERFLQQCSVTSLRYEGAPAASDTHLKAGVVPFIYKDGVFRFYLMKPVAKLQGRGAPPFQICKGTRQRRLPDDTWQDMREADLAAPDHEKLIATALREGEEELGLKFSNIKTLFDVGPYEFASAATGRAKHMWLYAAEMHSPDDVLADIAPGTDARRWLDLSEFAVVGRTDHLYILQDIEHKLSQHYAAR